MNKIAKKRLKYLEKQLGKKGIEFRPESYSWSVIQALISRGDRRLSKLLQLTRSYGDSLGSYKRAFKELKGKLPPLDYYVHDNWKTEQILPWSHLKGPLPEATLIKHLDTAMSVSDPNFKKSSAATRKSKGKRQKAKGLISKDFRIL